ncbi:hypothetical protein LZB50_09505, partial [Campylobacter jejuni]|uniref:hypothetical protein n=1 Tax=Campylobacter jejuni TaxID=197 RepID=UPI001F09B0EB
MQNLRFRVLGNIRRVAVSVVGLLGVSITLLAQAESGITDTKIVLGQSAAFSGPAAQLGLQLHA